MVRYSVFDKALLAHALPDIFRHSFSLIELRGQKTLVSWLRMPIMSSESISPVRLLRMSKCAYVPRRNQYSAGTIAEKL
jgi:hypothetical protein